MGIQISPASTASTGQHNCIYNCSFWTRSEVIVRKTSSPNHKWHLENSFAYSKITLFHWHTLNYIPLWYHNVILVLVITLKWMFFGVRLSIYLSDLGKCFNLLIKLKSVRSLASVFSLFSVNHHILHWVFLQ